MHRLLIALSLALTGAVATASEPSPDADADLAVDESAASTPASDAADGANGANGANGEDGAVSADAEEGSGGFVDLTDDTVLSADPTRPQVEIYLPVTRRRHGPLFPSAIDGTAPRPPAPR